MKIQRLEITNIASIEAAVIDFDRSPLAGADVFLISGNVGAGKSTILDCICLALYGGTPRLVPGAKGEDADTARILREGTVSSCVTLDFIANDGTPCRAQWSRRRARNKLSGALQKPVWVLTHNPDTASEVSFTKKADVTEAVRRAVGVGYHDFCRTTMLAQGHFASFLKGSDDDKASVLEKLTGTQTYTLLGKRIYQVYQDADRACADELTRCNAIPVLSEDEKQALQESLVAETAKTATARAKLDAANARSNWFASSLRLASALAAAEAALTKAQNERATDEAAAARKFIADWDASHDARALLARKVENERVAKDAEASIAALRKKVAKLRSAWLYISRPDFLSEDERAKAEADSALDIAAQAERKASEALDECSRELIRARSLHIFAEEKELLALDAELAGQRQREKELTAEYSALDAVAREAERAFSTVNMSQQKAVTAMRAKLRTGDVCPVCAREITEPILPDAEIYSHFVLPLETRAKETRDAAEEKREAMEKLRRGIALGDNDCERRSAALEREKTQFAEEEERLGIRFELPEDAAIPTAAEAGDAVGKASIARENAISAHAAALKRHNSAKDRAVKSEAELEAARGLLERRLVSLRPLVCGLQEARPEWFVDEVAAATAFDDAILAEASGFLVRFSTLDARRLEALGAVDKLNADIEAYLADAEFGAEYFYSLCSVDNDGIAAMRRADKALDEAVASAEAAVKTAREAIEKNEGLRPADFPDGADADALKADVEVATAELEAAGAAVGRTRARLEGDDDNRRRRAEIEEAIRPLKERRDVLFRLYAMFGSADGKKFRTIAQSYILANLIHGANHYMRSLMPRYRLVGSPNSYQIDVEDSYDGYARRSAKHISGGETFVVSLALALALADIGTGLAVDTLFIDEGFGNLSGKPLEDAVETLRTLRRRGGRRVGIISHIESLRDRIPVQIHVEQIPGRNTSRIQIPGL